MAVDLNRVIEQVSKEKGIDKSIVISAVEEMMHSAARRTFGAERNIESRFNPDLGEVELFEIKTVVDHAAASGSEVELEDAHAKYDPDAQVGDEILIKLDTATMGRIAAQAAKQNLIQHIRDAERRQMSTGRLCRQTAPAGLYNDFVNVLGCAHGYLAGVELR